MAVIRSPARPANLWAPVSPDILFNSSEQETSAWEENESHVEEKEEEWSQQMANLGDLGRHIQMLKIGTALLALICNMCGTAAAYPSGMHLAVL